jgi:response regulator NasT
MAMDSKRRLRVMLVDENDERAATLIGALREAGYDVVARFSCSDNLVEAVAAARADVVLVDMDNPARDMLDSCAAVSRLQPLPIVLFARDSNTETISSAVQAGVSAYVVGGMPEQRLRSIMDVAIARFREHQALRAELETTRTRLADRRDIDRAKAILGRARGLTEPAAYEALRKSAMERRMTIGDAARTVLAAADLFHPDSGD